METKPALTLSKVDRGSVSSLIAETARELRNARQDSHIPEMTERCMQSNNYEQCLAIVKDYVVII